MRKEHIDTIPVWDAYRSDCECPLCELQARAETSNIDYFLGESVMEPDQRIEVNQKGFCSAHLKKLYDAGNRLGLGLMAHTHMKELLNELKECEKAINGAPAGKRAFGLLAPKMDLAEVSNKIRKLTKTCVVCERMDQSMERYRYTILYMYTHEPDFADQFRQSKGLCLLHYSEMIDEAEKQLSGEHQKNFTADLAHLQVENFARLEQEIWWFTQKFDYRNEDKPWGNSRDAVKRSVNKLRSKVIE
ncbi:MAG: ABC transporter substrate-binding protein [Clostridia bacterium]|nr:ABC transporter substrate-binding protein [Clostridia bacterium]